MESYQQSFQNSRAQLEHETGPKILATLCLCKNEHMPFSLHWLSSSLFTIFTCSPNSPWFCPLLLLSPFHCQTHLTSAPFAFLFFLFTLPLPVFFPSSILGFLSIFPSLLLTHSTPHYTINWQRRTSPYTLQLPPKIFTSTDFCWIFQLHCVNSLWDFFVLTYLLFFPSFFFLIFPLFISFKRSAVTYLHCYHVHHVILWSIVKKEKGLTLEEVEKWKTSIKEQLWWT